MEPSNPLNFISKFGPYVGFFPFHLVWNRNEVILKVSRKFQAWGFFLAIAILCGVIVLEICDYKWYREQVILEWKLGIAHTWKLNNFFLTLTAVASATFTSLKKDSFEVFIHNIAKVDWNLRQLNIMVVESKKSKFITIAVFVLTACIFVSNSLVSNIDIKGMPVYTKIEDTLFLICIYLVLGFTFFHWNLIIMISCRVTAMKNILKISRDESQHEEFIRSEDDSANDNTKLERQQNYAGFTDVMQLIKVYGFLFDAAQAFDELCRFVFTLTLVQIITRMIITLFVCYLHMTDTYSIGHNYLYPLLSSIFLEAMVVCMMVEPGHSCEKEVEAMRHALTVLLNCESENYSDILALLDLVKVCPIKFYIYDVIPINRSLYTSMILNLTTYLMIVFQMRKR